MASNFAVDNNYSSRWASSYADPATADAQWIYVDLGATYNITKVRVNWERAYGKDYEIQVSQDALTWTPVKSRKNNTSLIDLISGINASAKFVRLYATARGTGFGYSVYELEVSASNTAPSVILTQPGANSTYTGPINLSANASDPDGAVTKVDFYIDNVLVGTDTTSPYVVNWPTTSTGTHVAKAVATDDNGATTTSFERTFYTDNNLRPTVQLTSPASNSTFTNQVNFAATASDADGTITKVDFVREDFSTGEVLIGSDATAPYSFEWTNVPAGTYRVYARATDNNRATVDSERIELTTTGSNTPPKVILTAPQAADYPKPARINIAADASDSDGAVKQVAFYAGSTLLNIDTTSPYAYTWTDAATGVYDITAVATDNGGATTTSIARRVRVVSEPPLLTLTSPVQDCTYSAPVVIAAEASDLDGTIAQVEIYSAGFNSVLLARLTAPPYTYTWTNVTPGSQTILVKAIDNDGRSTSLYRDFIVEAATGKNIPGKLQAENYDQMSGVATEPTADTGGGQNVGYIDAGDWLDYAVSVQTAGNYALQFRVAGFAAGAEVQLKSGATVLATVPVPNTGGGQNWTTTAPVTLPLPAGSQTLRVAITGGGFNLNWLDFALVSSAVSTASTTSQAARTSAAAGETIQAYPNPGNGQFRLTGVADGTPTTVVDGLGRTVAETTVHNGAVDISSLRAGTYLLRIQGKNKVTNLRLIKE